MRKQLDQSTDSFVRRHLSQLKILARLVEHEIEGSKQGPSITLDRDLAESLLDLLEIFVDAARGGLCNRPSSMRGHARN